LKDERGNIREGALTSNISVSAGLPLDMPGTILSGSGAIQWSNSTQWRKQSAPLLRSSEGGKSWIGVVFSLARQ
jgi:hypothetical protein